MASQIDIELSAKLDKIDKALDSLVKSTESQAKAIQNQFSNAFLSIAAVATAALGAISFKEMIDSAIEADNTVTRLNVALKLAGNFSASTSAEFQALSTELERTTGVSDEVINSLFATAQALGFTVDETKNLASASVNVAALLGKDVQGTFDELARTLNGDLPRGLARAVPELKQFSKEALIGGAAVEFLSKRAGDAGAAVKDNFGGQLQIATVQLKNVFEETGKIITQNPVFVALLRRSAEVFAALAEAIARNSGEMIKFTTSAIVGFLTGLNAAIQFVDKFKIVLIALSVTLVQTFASSTIAAGITSFIGLIGKAVIAVYGFVTSITVARVQTLLFQSAITFGLSIAVAGLVQLFTTFENPLQLVALKFREAAVAVLTFLKTIAPKGAQAAFQKQIDELNKTIDQTRASAEKLAGAQDKVNDTNKNGIDTTLEMIKGLGDRASLETKLGNSATKASADRQKELKKEADLLKGDVSNSLKQLQTSLKNVGVSEKEQLGNTFKERTDLLDKAFKLGVLKEQELANLKFKANLDYQTQLTALEQKEAEKRAKIAQEAADAASQRLRIASAQAELVSSAAANPAQALFNPNVAIGKFQQEKGVTGEDIETAQLQTQIGALVGVTAEFVKGAEGAGKAVSGILGAVVNTLLPGIGGVAAQLFETLAQGPEKVKALVTSFVDAIPGIITTIASSIPIFFTAIIDQVPFLIDAIIASLDEVIIGLAKSIGPIVQSIIKSLINLPRLLADQVPIIVTAFIDEIPKIIFAFIDQIPILIDGIIMNLPRLIDGLIAGFINLVTILVDKAPDIITKLVEKAPLLISELISKLPLLIADLASRLPELAIKFVTAIISQTPDIAGAFSLQLIDKLPGIATSFLKNLLAGLKDGLDKLIKSLDPREKVGKFFSLNDDGGIGGFLRGIGLAEGGVIPQGFPNDTFPARLTSGERVISPGENERLSQFLDRAEQGGGTGAPQNLTVNLMIGEEQLANVILQLNQRGFRLQ